MTHELILTSAVQGLSPKVNGLVPMVSSEAMSPRIVEYLFALSGYRHTDFGSGKPPVAYSHFILPGGIEHVLSREAEFGIDDQQQPTIVAHHIVLEGMEFVPEGPAWLLALPGFHLSEWNEPPLRFSHGRPIPTLTNPPSLTRRQLIARQCRGLDPSKMTWTGCVDTESEEHLSSVRSNDYQIVLAAPPTTPCPTWQKAAGDPGWGGVLAATSFTGQPVVIIYNPEQNILPLIVEALALLPSYCPWQTTFCTYFTNLPDTISCQWKGALAGSDEAKRCADDSTYLVLDLTLPMGEAPPEKYVDFARHGREDLLPQDADEQLAALTNADTKSYGLEDNTLGKSDIPSHKIPDALLPLILSRKHSNLFETLLHHSSRSQFYILYSVMFALVLFLLVLAVDQAGNLGLVQWLKHGSQQAIPVFRGDLKQEVNSEPKIEAVLELEILEPSPLQEAEDVRKLFEENREKQKGPLRQCLDNLSIPKYSALNFPSVQDNQIDLPEKKTLGELSPLQPFGEALELRFIPLFELPKIQIETRLLVDALPDLIWQVEAVERNSTTPIFHFQLTEAGLEMDWHPLGLGNQHLYGTILSSLGFLQLSVADSPEAATQIQLFEPMKTEPVKIADLAGRAESENPEYVVELPFAAELWQRIFAERNPPNNVLLKVWTEPDGDWIQRKPSPPPEFCAEVLTAQQVGRQTENGETVFENIGILFAAAASLEKVVWKGDEYAGRLRAEAAEAKKIKDELEGQIRQLDVKVFEGNESARTERDRYRAECQQYDSLVRELESILEKLPAAYKEIGRNEMRRFHYSVSLQPPEGEQTLLILTTDR